jgi:hypothetical protein
MANALQELWNDLLARNPTNEEPVVCHQVRRVAPGGGYEEAPLPVPVE